MGPNTESRAGDATRRCEGALVPAEAMPSRMSGLARRLLGFEALSRLHDALPCGLGQIEFARSSLDRLGVHIWSDAAAIAAIPKSGPLIFVSNHPHGGLDGLAALSVLGAARPDLKILANLELQSVPELADAILPLDPYGGVEVRRVNGDSVRRALSWLEQGHALLVFPAGEVSRLDIRRRQICDPRWRSAIARLILLSRASVVPMRITGSNSSAFQAVSLISRAMGTRMLAREMLTKRGRTLPVLLGTALSPSRLQSIGTDEELIAHLRLRSDLLARPEASMPEPPRPVSAALRCADRTMCDSELIRMELERLPAEARLVTCGSMRVYCATAEQLPLTMQEIGRLRERTFRAAGEGTKRSVDLDLFDNYYEHLVLWDASAQVIVGGCRIAKIDLILRRFGNRGLHISTSFDLREPLLDRLGSALELGRTFVRVERQRSHAPLLLLWRGIAEYVGREPRYCRLLGLVSIGQSYRQVSRELIVDCLRAHSLDQALAPLVRPRRPFRSQRILSALGSGELQTCDLNAIDALVAEVEPDSKGVPVLLRQHLKLGGRILGFNVETAFANSIDCLVLIDLRRTPYRLLRKYMTAAALLSFNAAHRDRPAMQSLS